MAHWKIPDPDRMESSQGEKQAGEIENNGNTASSPMTPLALRSLGKRSFHVRSQSLNGRIQKPSVARSHSFNTTKCAKLAHRNHHMDALQAQLLHMKASGINQRKFVNVVEKLKGMYLSQGEQQQQQQEDRTMLKCSLPTSPLSARSSVPSSPLSTKSSVPTSPLPSNQTFPRIEDRPAEASTIALLLNKFAKLERYKESIQGQQLQVYPSPNFQTGRSSAQRTPTTSTPCSPRVGLDDSYYFDESTAALIALQQEMMTNTYRSATSSVSEDAFTSPESMGSPAWSACESPVSVVSGSKSPRSDEAANALLHYMLQPPHVGRPPHSNMNAFQTTFQNMSLAGGAMGKAGSAGTPESLGGLLAAERMEILMEKKSALAPQSVASETKLASTIQQVVAKFPFNLTAKFSSPKSKRPGAWGKCLSLNTPVVPLSDSPTERPWATVACKSSSVGPDVQWCNTVGGKCSNDMLMRQQELIDTSLHL